MAVSVGVERGLGRQPVMADVARLAGVSQKTVSRVVNDAPNVRAAVRDRVHQAIADLGYRPNATARALVTQRTGVIGIVTPGSPLYGPSAQLVGLERAAHEAGYGVVIVSTADGAAADLEAAVLRLLDLRVDGVAIGVPLGSGLREETFRGVPFVVVGDPLPGLAEHIRVCCDQVGGGRMATEHLLNLGHQRVHHVAGPDTWYAARSRTAGWAQALDAAGVPRSEVLHGDWTAASGYAAGLVLADRPDVTAIFAANDHMATGVLRALHERGRAVPGDVSVVGFDDAPESEFAMIPLTTVRQDFAAITRRAVEALLAVMAGRDLDGPTSLPVELVVRSSTGPAP